MPIVLPKFVVKHRHLLRDVRPVSQRIAEYMQQPSSTAMVFGFAVAIYWLLPQYVMVWPDFMMILVFFYFRWFYKRPFVPPLKMPKFANLPDPHNPPPGRTGSGKSDGILFVGNISDEDDPYELRKEIWLTNTDARTHILYLGTTGAGKTEGLKSIVTNALTWGSGFVYVDGKADTDLWASLYALARRFGRDDDLLVLNYMTGNTDEGSVSNSMNPFSNGSSSYLANMITSFMPDAGGDNAMWKERAMALMFALMPALTWKRDKQGLLLDIGVVRDNLEMQPIIRLARDPNLPERIIHGLQGYLNTLPGYVDAAFDDEGNERPPSPDQPMYDLQVARQQHGYLSMQFTRALQMLADEYGYIFKVQLADIDVLDVVLNRRILIVLIPALEKNQDEAANLGKIVAASLKGMMGATLGNTVEGSWEMAIGSKQTRSSSSFMTVFDEVGYYTAQGMAVMAAQARSLGFSLIFASQDLPSMEKKIKTEAKSIVGNCNLKIFGKIEDPTDTREFLNKHAGTAYVLESSGMSAPTNTISSLFFNMPFVDNRGTTQTNQRQRVDYDHIRFQREGEVHILFADWFLRARMFFVAPEKVKALRVHRFLPVPGTTSSTAARERAMHELATRLKDPEWTATSASSDAAFSPEVSALAKGYAAGLAAKRSTLEASAMALANFAILPPPAKTAVTTSDSAKKSDGIKSKAGGDRAQPAVIPEISVEEKAALRAGLPPLYEGDQYAVQEVAQSTAKPKATTNFVTTDADLAVVMRPGTAAEEPGVMDVKLPANIAAMLEQSAKKLNRGISEGKR